MVVVMATFVLLSVGISAGAWSWTRLRARRAGTPLGPGRNQIDNWLLQHHGLPPPEQEQVRAAVFGGRQVSNPALAAAASDLAAKVLSKEIKVLPGHRVLWWITFLAGLGLAVTAGPLIRSHHAAWQALSWVSVLTSGPLMLVTIMVEKRVSWIRKNASIALELNQSSSSANSTNMDQTRAKS